MFECALAKQPPDPIETEGDDSEDTGKAASVPYQHYKS